GRRYVIGQCNNVFVFPGIGLGVLISEASRVSDSLFLAAARALAQFTQTRAEPEALYPKIDELRSVSRSIAISVAQTAREEGFGRSHDNEALEKTIDEFCWFPDYPPKVASLPPQGNPESAAPLCERGEGVRPSRSEQIQKLGV